MSVLVASFRRDFLIWGSYRLAAVWQPLGVLFLTGTVYMATLTLSGEGAPAALTTGFIAFALSGLAFTDSFLQCMTAVPTGLRDHQKAGTLEPMLLAPASLTLVALGSAVFRLALALGRTICFLVLGTGLLGLWHHLNPITGALVFVAAGAAFLGLGLLSAAFVVLVKHGDPVVLLYSAATVLVGGAMFPIHLLPDWLQWLAMAVPLTHALSGMRAALDGKPPAEVIDQLTALALMTAVLLPAGVLALHWAVARAKEDGSLVEY